MGKTEKTKNMEWTSKRSNINVYSVFYVFLVINVVREWFVFF